jgi:protein SCO1/2
MNRSFRRCCTAIWLVLTLMVVTAACSPANSLDTSQLRGAVFNPPRPLEDFTLASTQGESFTLSDHRGQVILLYFGYRSCPDFCPTTFLELKKVYTALNEPKDRLKIAFVTVDPERDTVENLALYTNAFHADFIGLRGEGDVLQKVVDEFGVVATKRQMGDSALAYLVDHTASVFLIDADGDLLVQYLYGTDYRDIVHDLQLILQTGA